jgi:hypothetical protein
MIDITSLEVLIPCIFGVIGFIIYITVVIMNMRLISENKMGGTIVGKLLGRLGISWIVAGITSVIMGVAWLLQIEYNVGLIALMIIMWFLGAFLVLDAIRKWKKEMK